MRKNIYKVKLKRCEIAQNKLLTRWRGICRLCKSFAKVEDFLIRFLLYSRVFLPSLLIAMVYFICLIIVGVVEMKDNKYACAGITSFCRYKIQIVIQN